MYIAHRGLHGVGVPENSLAAFAAASAAGHAIECDVRLTGDGAPLVFHDAVLARPGGARRIAGLTAAEIAQATRGAAPTLAAALATIRGTVPLFIEAKPTRDTDALARAIVRAAMGYRGALAAMSFDMQVCAALRRHGWQRPLGLVASLPPAPATLRRVDFVALAATALATLPAPAYSRLRHALGRRPLLTWTVTSRRHARRLERRADGLIFERFAP